MSRGTKSNKKRVLTPSTTKPPSKENNNTDSQANPIPTIANRKINSGPLTPVNICEIDEVWFSLFTDVYYRGIITGIRPRATGGKAQVSMLFDDGETDIVPVDSLFKALPPEGKVYLGHKVQQICPEVIRAFESLPPPSQDPLPDISDSPLPSFEEASIYNLHAAEYVPLAQREVAQARVDADHPPVEAIPTLSDVVDRIIPFMKRVPKNCRDDFCKALVHLLQEIVVFKSFSAWLCFFMFVPTVLAPLPKELTNSKKNEELKARMAKWDGAFADPYGAKVKNRIAMWRDTPNSVRVGTEDPIKRALRLAEEGRYSLACHALADVDKLAPPSQQVFDSLQDKHPKGPTFPRPDQFPPHQRITAEEVETAVKSFKPLVSGGPSRLTPDHIKDAVTANLQKDVFQALANVANLIAAADVPEEVQPFLTGAFLTPMHKEKGGIRPIACGDVLRRIVSKVCVAKSKDAIRTHFHPFQFGIAVPGGAEVVVHAWRDSVAALKGVPNKVALKIDIDNAFNRVHRAAVLALVAEKFPQMYAFVWLCYGNHSNLIMRDCGEYISSQQGVQQGDPLAPFLFCLALLPCIQHLSEGIPNLNLNAWYMDDGGIIGDAIDVFKALTYLMKEGPTTGIFVSDRKCEIFWLEGEEPPLEVAREDPFPRSLQRLRLDEIVILGIPIGSKAFSNNYLKEKVLSKVSHLAGKLKDLKHAQTAYLLLRYCISFCRMAYHLRLIPPELIEKSTQSYVDLTLNAFTSFFSYNLDDRAVKQIELNLKRGGLGLRNSKTHHPAIYLASLSTHLPQVSTILKRPTQHLEDLRLSLVHQLTPLMPPNHFDEPTAKTFHQQTLCDLIDERHFDDLLLTARTNADKARLIAVSRPHASAFLSAPPITSLNLNLTSAEWNAAVAYRIGATVIEKNAICQAINCGTPLDPQAHHALRCKQGNDKHERHEEIVYFLVARAKSAKMHAQANPKNIVRNAGARPGDLTIPGYTANKLSAFDFSCTDPTQSACVARAASTPLFAADQRANAKQTKYADVLADNPDIAFYPIIAETFGGWNKEAEELFHRIASWTTQNDLSKCFPIVLNQLHQRASVILQRHNAKIITRRVNGASALGA